MQLSTQSKEIQQIDVVATIKDRCNKALTPSNITYGFEKDRIWPLNREAAFRNEIRSRTMRENIASSEDFIKMADG